MKDIPYVATIPNGLQDLSEGVIYARYSSHSQRDVSIEQQIRACKLFAERHGVKVVKIYEDRALTGTNDKRPGFQQMIQDAKRGGWNYVIVYTLDRFARDRYDSAVYKRQLKNLGVKVLSAMENISDDHHAASCYFAVFFLDGEGIQERLAGVCVCSVTGIDY